MARLKLGRVGRAIRGLPAETMEDVVAILNELKKRCPGCGCDRVVIVWDEFGRHLERLVSEGRGDALGDVQMLAEFVARCRDIPMTLGLLLHQGLLHYAGHLSQSVRAGWQKIEGRFRTIQHTDHSKEIYRLIAEVLADRAPTQTVPRSRRGQIAVQCKDLGVFADFTQSELGDLLHASQPLDPVALYLLPRFPPVSPRTSELSLVFSTASIYRAASTLPPCTTTFRPPCGATLPWVVRIGNGWKPKSPLTKVPDDESAVKALKTACLWAWGPAASRPRTGRELLLLAWKASRRRPFGRKPSPSWSIATCSCIGGISTNSRCGTARSWISALAWKTTARLRRRFRPARVSRQGGETARLETGAVQRRLLRPAHLTGRVSNGRQLNSYLNWDVVLNGLANDCDGKVIYLVAENAEEFREAEQIARERLNHERLIVAIPASPCRSARRRRRSLA